MKNPKMDTFLRAYSRRLNLALWLERTLPGIVGAVVAWAVVAVLAKLVMPEIFPWAPMVFIFAPVWMVWSWISLKNQNAFFGPAEAAECIDLKFRRDGTVPTYEEMREYFDDPRMEDQIHGAERVGLPALRSKYYFGRTLPSLLLALGALLIPFRPQASVPGSAQENIRRMTEPLEAKTKQYEELIPDEQLEEFREELEDLGNTDRGLTREHWEALEELQRRIDESALAEATKRLQLAERAASEAQKIADAMEKAAGAKEGEGSGLSPQEREAARKAMENLKEAIEEMGKSGNLSEGQKEKLAEMKDALTKAASQLAKQSSGSQSSIALDPEMLKQFSQMQAKMASSAQALSPEQLQQALQACQKSGSCNSTSPTASSSSSPSPSSGSSQSPTPSQDLASVMAQLGQQAGGSKPGSSSGSMSGAGMPGQGGISRGRGDAQMTFGDEQSIDAEFDNKKVRNRMLEREHMLDMGIRAMPPRPDPKTFSPATVRQFESESGSGVSRNRISPSQREVISNYFSE
jgi:hypothetical protein